MTVQPQRSVVLWRYVRLETETFSSVRNRRLQSKKLEIEPGRLHIVAMAEEATFMGYKGIVLLSLKTLEMFYYVLRQDPSAPMGI